MADDHTLIKIQGRDVGIAGLQGVFEDLAGDSTERSDEETADWLVRHVSRKNYIAPPARADYAAALLREYHKFTGQAVAEDAAAGTDIQVVGPGCAQCDQLERDLYAVLEELKMAASVDHVRDIHDIAALGIMGTPALIINGTVRSVGKLPPRRKLKEWLGAAASSD